MKHFKIIIGLLFFATLFISCEKETINTTEEPDMNSIQQDLYDYPNSLVPKDKTRDLNANKPGNKSSHGCGIINGSFETGDFTGWNISDMADPLFPWDVVGDGNNIGFGFDPTSAQDGDYVAWNAFDGGGPDEFVMYQDILVCSCAELSWKHKIQWNWLGIQGTQPRTLDVQLRDPLDNSILTTLYSFSTETINENSSGNTGWISNSYDISNYEGSTVRVYFKEYIPEFYTGPATIEFDDIAVNELDSDGDGVCDSEDNCRDDANEDQANYDGDLEGDICDADDDNDGCLDEVDPVQFSNIELTVDIDGCDSGVENRVTSSCGYTMSDMIDDLEAGTYKNHGAFARTVAKLTKSWVDEGLISQLEKDAIMSCAGGASIP